MTATLQGVAELCRDSLALADAVERCGGPPPERAAEFYRGKGLLEAAREQLDGGVSGQGLGFLPILAIGAWEVLGWVLAGTAAVAAVATLPALIRGSRQVTETVSQETSGIVSTTGKVLTLAQYGALALAAYWGAKLVLKKGA